MESESIFRKSVVSRRDDVRPRSSERYFTTGYDCGLNVVMKVRQRIKEYISRWGCADLYGPDLSLSPERLSGG